MRRLRDKLLVEMAEYIIKLKSEGVTDGAR